MSMEEIFEKFKAEFEQRKFFAGLLVSFIDFLDYLTEGKKFNSFEKFIDQYPKQDQTRNGKPANTLIVDDGQGSTKSLRPFYNKIEKFFRVTHKRFDYPSCAPHATQAWVGYEDWLDSLVRLSADERAAIRERVITYVLNELKSQEYDPGSVKVDPPTFALLLTEFDLSKHIGEPTGAAFQGVAFGFLRADNPHLQVEISKVRTGSKRLQRVGDIDCWDGARLAISAEVKQYGIGNDNLPNLEAFANEVRKRGAIGMVIALSITQTASSKIRDLELIPLEQNDLLNIVRLWDPVKQRIAVTSFEYYVRHIEKNSSISDRLKAFLDTINERPQKQQ